MRTAPIGPDLRLCSTYMRHFSHRRKQIACTSQSSFAYKESRQDSYPQFALSPLGMPGSMPPFSRQIDEKQRLVFRTNAGINQRDARSYSLF